jgi:imidazolonepropionase-like amidohydrolase
MRFPSPSLSIRSLAVVFFASALSASAQITTAPKHGIRENDPRLHALTNARVVTAPGKVIDKGVVVIRDGVIVDVGPGR